MDEKPSAVLDTGIILQAALRPTGPAGRLLSLLDQDLFTVSISEEVIAEYEDVLARPSIRKKNPHLTEELVRAIIERLRSHAVLQPAPPRHFRYARDPDDEHVIDLAIETNARYLVTRDQDLLDLMDENQPEGQLFRQRFPGLTILDPVAFLQGIAPRSDRES
jgi:putative PIN family toxin of toxin-antitoxin system